MRVPSISIYGNSTYNLGKLTTNLQEANLVASTQKRINSICDDPIGISQILDLDLTLGNLEQLNKNVDMGKTWLDGAEAAMKGIQEEVLTLKTLSSQWVNATMNATERKDAAERVQGAINQILDLCNTQINGSYIFSGTSNNVRAFSLDDEEHPTKAIYHGSDNPFTIKTGKIHSLEVGLVGPSALDEEEIRVDSTNNTIVFTEDPNEGANTKRILEAKLPDGVYSPEELAVLVRNGMNKASEDAGYQITYEVDYDAQTRQFTFGNDGTHDGYMETDLLWKSGETPRVDGVEGEGILTRSIDVDVLNEQALTLQTPKPPGTAPFQLTRGDNGRWKVLNDPGYGLPAEIDGGDRVIELDLSRNGVPDIRISLEGPAIPGNTIRFEINSESDDHSIGTDLGFSGDMRFAPPSSDEEVTLKQFDHTNNVIDFQEDIGLGLSSQLSAAIKPGDYADMDELAVAVENAMEAASVNKIDYEVGYSRQTRKFTVKDSTGTLTELRLLWNTGTHQAGIGAGSELGFDTTADDTGAVSHVSDDAVTFFDIQAGVNDTINFKEIRPGGSSADANELTATISPGSYDSIEDFTRAVEDAMEKASAEKGNRVDYEVSYSYISHRFTIKEDGDSGKQLESLDLLWETGSGSVQSAAQVLGFREQDVAESPAKGEEVTWGVFETLIDLKGFLETNDMDGLQRTITRLDTHYNSITSVISDLGVKANRIDVSKQVNAESKLTITERKSMIEDADIVESIMKLQALQTAYQASLSTTSKIMSTSLVDFL